MPGSTFRGIVLRKDGEVLNKSIEQIKESDLPEGEVLIDVEYSSINYKDGMIISGRPEFSKLVRNYPMVPGIDMSGTVASSNDSRYKAGDKVIATSYGIGEAHWGGLAEKARVKADWLVKMPEGLDAKKAMIIGTAGFTAMLCVNAIASHMPADKIDGEVLVTGASGGVGSFAVRLLSTMGYNVAAVTGRVAENSGFLSKLGAKTIIDRKEFEGKSRPMDKARWGACVDVVSGDILTKVISQMKYDGPIAMCGLAGGMEVNSSVMPFILRSVVLIGCDSVTTPHDRRVAAWGKLGEILDEGYYTQATTVIGLDDAIKAADDILDQKITGRVIVDLKKKAKL